MKATPKRQGYGDKGNKKKKELCDVEAETGGAVDPSIPCEKGIVRITVIAAQNLPTMDFGGGKKLKGH